MKLRIVPCESMVWGPSGGAAAPLAQAGLGPPSEGSGEAASAAPPASCAGGVSAGDFDAHATQTSVTSARRAGCRVGFPASETMSRIGTQTTHDAGKRTVAAVIRSLPMKRPATRFELRTVDELEIGDEPSFRHVALYADLKEVLRRAAYPFRVLPKTSSGRANRALLLNLTFWSADSGGDVLVDAHPEADVVAHAAWHHLAARALARGPAAQLSVEALFLGEAIASAFDVYLVGRLLGHAPRSTFLESQVLAMAETAQGAGLSEAGFAKLLRGIARGPERAFADLRELLSDATRALFSCRSAEQAHGALRALDGHRFSALLHRYELSNWVLYARAYGQGAALGGKPDPRARAVERALRKAKDPLSWLVAAWVRPALGPGVAERA